MKKIFLTPLIIACITVLSGCEKDGKNLGIPRENMTDNTAVTEYIMQEGDTQIVGEVTQIVGNEVTLALGESVENSTEKDMQEMPQNKEKPQFDTKNGESPQMRQDGDMPQMPDDIDFHNMDSSEGPEFKRGGRKSSVSVKKNGEKGTYIIPVGMTVSGASGRNNDYSAISAGMTIRLTLNSDGYTVSAEIL